MEKSEVAVLFEVMREVAAIKVQITRLSEYTDYVFIACMKGDPRFNKPEFAKADFDADEFDRKWVDSKKNIPPEFQ